MNKYVEYMMNRLVLRFAKPGEGQGRAAVLIICRQPLGDTVLASPLIRGIRAAYPEHHLTLVCSPENFNLLERCPYADEILPYAAQVQGSYLRSHLRKARRFAREHFSGHSYELAVIPCTGMPSLPEAWLAYFSGAERRIAYSERFNPDMHREFMGLFDRYFTDAPYDEQVKHEVERNLELLKLLGAGSAAGGLELWIDGEDRARASGLLRELGVPEQGLKLIVNLKSSEAARDWPVERYIEVCRQLREHHAGISFLLTGSGASAREYSKDFRQALPEAFDLVDRTTIRQLAAVMGLADLYLGGDTGPLHLAAACHLGGVALYRSARKLRGRLHLDSQLRSPWQAEIACLEPPTALPGCEAGCFRKEPHCILQITAEQVSAELEAALARAAGTSDSEGDYAGSNSRNSIL